MWKLTGKEKGWEPLPGGPTWRDLTDEEFEAAAERYATMHQFEPDALHKSGYWKHEADRKLKGTSPSSPSDVYEWDTQKDGTVIGANAKVTVDPPPGGDE